MTKVILLFGAAIAIMGIVFLKDQKALEKYIMFWKKEKRLRVGGVFAILIGVVFLIVAPECRLSGLVTFFGLWSIIKGVLLLTLSEKKMFVYLDWWLNKPVLKIRFIGILAIIIGALFMYAA
ncbi:MAG: hypothetical protein ABIJ27_07885 [Candidatus Omnitrophota bacterium]